MGRIVQDITSKTIDGITDLVVVAPIREGFIEAYENVSFATRLKLVAEALNRVRVAARKHERITPFSDDPRVAIRAMARHAIASPSRSPRRARRSAQAA